MTLEELKLRRLSGQHLLTPAPLRTVVKDILGVQAQFLSHALFGLRLRSDSAEPAGLVKSWTLRGTMHLFSREDLPLFLHAGRKPFLRPVDTLDADACVSGSRKAYFAQHILDAMAQGVCTREALKERCRKAGMTGQEEASLFDPWGGIIRALCEKGKIVHQVSREKAYALCPDFTPMEEHAAQVELARRYFTHFGPASVKDAAYFFGTTQKMVKALLWELPLEEVHTAGRSYFFIPIPQPRITPPPCIFLTGFDQLMLGYDKRESLFLPQAYMGEIFNRAGIVRPAILVHGSVVGWWKLEKKKLKLRLLDTAAREVVEATARWQWSELDTIEDL